jgi:hypothetical protein
VTTTRRRKTIGRHGPPWDEHWLDMTVLLATVEEWAILGFVAIFI